MCAPDPPPASPAPPPAAEPAAADAEEAQDAPPPNAELDTPDAEPTCPACAEPAGGAYCAACGSATARNRLTLRSLWAEFASRVFSFDRGLLATALELSRRPGLVPLRFVEGRRKLYTNPLTYVLLASALSLFMLRFSEDVLREQTTASMAQQAEARATADSLDALAEGADTPDPYADEHRDLDPDEQRLQDEADRVFGPGADPQEFFSLWMTGMRRFNSLFTVFLCVPLALLLRLLFGPARNVAETFVFGLYVVGHAVLVTAFVTPVLVRLHPLASLGSVLVYVALAAWAARVFWGEGWSAALRAAAAMTVSYVVYAVFVMVVAVVYIFDVILTRADVSWGSLFGKLLS